MWIQSDQELRWDELKRWPNLEKHGVDFVQAEAFERADLRGLSAELRLVAMAPIGDRLHVMVFTLRRTCLRIISLRRANTKEILRYEAEI